MPNDSVSPKEFADRLHLPYPTVARWCQSGRIPATKRDGKWEIPREVLEQQIENRAKAAEGQEMLEDAESVVERMHMRAARARFADLRDEAAAFVKAYDELEDTHHALLRQTALPLLAAVEKVNELGHYRAVLMDLAIEIKQAIAEHGDQSTGWTGDPNNPMGTRVADAYARHAEELRREKDRREK